METSIAKNLSSMIRQQRGDATQQGFAERLGISQSQVSKWERGESVPHLEQIETLANDLGIFPEEFVARLYGRTTRSGSLDCSSAFCPLSSGGTSKSDRVNALTRAVHLLVDSLIE